MSKQKEVTQPERLACAFDLPDGHYMENGGMCGFNVRDGKVHLSDATFSVMRSALEKQDAMEELIQLHNHWYARELRTLQAIRKHFWKDLFERLSIPPGMNATVSRDGVVTRAVETKEDK